MRKRLQSANPLAWQKLELKYLTNLAVFPTLLFSCFHILGFNSFPSQQRSPGQQHWFCMGPGLPRV